MHYLAPGDAGRDAGLTVRTSIKRRRSGLSAAVGWSPDRGLVSATKAPHQEAITANNHPPRWSAGSFNPVIAS